VSRQICNFVICARALFRYVIVTTKPGRGHGVVINSDNDNDHQHNEDEIHEFLGMFF
jgi:hypothetical protein